MDRGIVQAITNIATNTHAGAVELAEQGADILLRCARTDNAETAAAFRQDVLLVGWALIRAQPAMAPLVNLVNTALWKIEPPAPLQTMRRLVIEAARDFKRKLHVHETAVAEATLHLIPEGGCVLTSSRSTTVRAALLHAQHAGRHFRVICAEGRPAFEGRMLATELAEAGIPVTLVIDTLAIAWVDQAQVILVGADHLTASGLVNKAGTYGLALAAQTNHVPIYTLCGSEKFLPSGYTPPPQDSRPVEQVWADAPATVTIANYYFDRTPLDSITGIVTERGVLPTEVIEGWLAAVHLHPALRS